MLGRMEDTKTYEGSCHCGNVRYEVTMTPPAKAFAGTCSICSRTGWLLAFVPTSQVKFLSGDDGTSDYQFGKKSIHHHFCSKCGVRSFSRGKDKEEKETIAVNLRCLSGLDATKLPLETFDCAKL